MVVKLYCFVDETGQDTLGKLFIVTLFIVDIEKEEILTILEEAEILSGKTRRKWIKTRKAERVGYLDMVLANHKIRRKIYFSIFHNTKEYEDLMVLSIGKSINLYTTDLDITEYKATIVIDGLKRSETRRVAKSLRQLGIKIHKVRGERDESNAILRLSDAIAGLIREASEGEEEFYKRVKKLLKEKVIYKLNP